MKRLCAKAALDLVPDHGIIGLGGGETISYLAEDIKDPATGEIIVAANHLVTPKRAAAIIKTGVTQVKIRTILTCRSHIGVCVFFAIGLLNLNDVAIGMGHRVV